jgi:Immunity protein 27
MPLILTGPEADAKRVTLRLVWTDTSGWESVLIDESTGECWRLDYPNSGYHGGGAARLTRLEQFARYVLSLPTP